MFRRRTPSTPTATPVLDAAPAVEAPVERASAEARLAAAAQHHPHVRHEMHEPRCKHGKLPGCCLCRYEREYLAGNEPGRRAA
jgi:hypothetical protein